MKYLDDHVIDSDGGILNPNRGSTGLYINQNDYIVNQYEGFEGMKLDRIKETIVDINGDTLYKITPFNTLVIPYKG